jgi:hypothetical protein
VTHLLVEPKELERGNLPDEFGDGPGDMRRQGVVSREQRQEMWDDTDLARLRDLREADDALVLAEDTVQ